MKRALLITLVMTVVALFALPLQAEDLPKQELQMYHVVMAKEGPNWKSQGSEAGMDVRMQVIEGIKKAAQSGLIVSAGLVNDETQVEFILILDKVLQERNIVGCTDISQCVGGSATNISTLIPE